MNNSFEKLLSVKSVITIMLTITFVVLSLKGAVDISEIYLMVIAFYFGTQSAKN